MRPSELADMIKPFVLRWIGDARGISGRGAPSNGAFVTMEADARLSGERVLTAGTGIEVVDGGADTTATVGLADTAVTPGEYGDATHVAQVTVDQQGRVTAAAEVAITAGSSKGVVSIVGNVVFLSNPETNSAYFGTQLLGGSTPKEIVGPLLFDADAIEYWDFLCSLTNYGGGGLTLTLPWLSAAATSGVCRWGAAIRRLNTGENFTAAHSYDFNDVDSTAQDTAGKIATPTVTFTNGADMDNWASGELAMVRVRRNATHENDTLVGDAVLIGFFGVET